MDLNPILLAPRRERMIREGYWHDRTINDYLDDCLASRPDKLALNALRVDDDVQTRFTYREMAALADRIAVGLSRLGIGKNDVVACQLPNWWQFTLTYLACSRLGAVMNPLMHIFRERELSFMLRHGEAKVLIVPKAFRGFDFEAMANDLAESLPDLRHIVVVDGEGDNSYEALLTAPEWEKEGDAATILLANRPGPDDVTQLIYTSGTTGEPKGVMHTVNTLGANIIPFAQRLDLGEDSVVLMASPMAHQTGFMYGLMMPIMLKGTAVLQDVWNPQRAIALANEHGVTFTMASTPFLTDLAQAVQTGGRSIPTLRTFLCAGAPIPGPLVEQAQTHLGAKVVSAWGMSENGAVTSTLLDDPDERACNTDGRPFPGVEIRIVDARDADLPTGEAGRLLLRACSNFGGYLKRPELNQTDEDDWFDTGDLAYKDEQGYIRITGRSKDVIIRGGENIPVVEIESLLYRHPAIAQVAIIAYPDERLGERACAVVVPKADQSITLDDVVDYLKSRKVAINYIPEKLEIVDAMPATPSGKIQKFRLRDMFAGQNR
ncbi:MAG: cyclohexanecarboxylate-CoA ligase [Castellaniella sp.]